MYFICKQCGIPYCAHIKRSCSIVSWPKDGCMSSRNMSPRAGEMEDARCKMRSA